MVAVTYDGTKRSNVIKGANVSRFSRGLAGFQDVTNIFSRNRNKPKNVLQTFKLD